MSKNVQLTLTISPRLAAYLKALVEMEGFGSTSCEVATGLVWDRVNDLIAAGRFRFVPPETTGETGR